MATPIAQRGEVWTVDMGMVAKIRPCIIFSVSALPHERLLVTVVPGTTSLMGTRFEIAVKAHFLKGSGAFDAQQIYTVHQVKLLKKLGTLPLDQLALVETSVKQWLGLT